MADQKGYLIDPISGEKFLPQAQGGGNDSGDSGSQAGNDTPSSEAMANALLKMSEMAEIEWTPIRFLQGHSTNKTLGVVSSNGSVGVTISNPNTYLSFFGALFGSDGTFVLTHNGSAWTYNGSNVSLSSSGLTITGTPSSGNTLTFTFSMSLPPGLTVFPINTKQTGLPYSSSHQYRNQISVNVMPKTFMTALQNPNSVLYTVNTKEGTNYGTAATYYGGVCSALNTGPFGLGMFSNFFENMYDGDWVNLDCEEISISSVNELKKLRLGDSILQRISGSGHTGVVTAITRDISGVPTSITTTEWWPPKVRRITYDANGFWDRWLNPSTSGYTDIWVYRYKGIKDTGFDESDWSGFTYNTDVAVDKGDSSWYDKSETLKITAFAANISNYTDAVLYRKDGSTWKSIGSYPLSQFSNGYGTTKVYSVVLSAFTSGEYRVRLEGNSNSDFVYFSLIDFGTLEVDGNVLTFGGYSDNLEPVAVMWCDFNNNFHAEFARELTENEIIKGQATLLEPPSKTVTPYGAISFKFAYGYVYGPFVARGL